MSFSKEFLSEVEDRNDIYDVVSSYVRLDKKSGSNYFGLCPFHNEKTPSFSVSPERRMYHCFGCGKGGGVINFVMEMESLNFPEAVEFLAKRAGLAIPQGEEDPDSKRRARILALNKDAARFFYSQLNTESGRAGRSYIAKRQISRTTATNFGLGYAPDTWDSLRKEMHSKGYSDMELMDADLIRASKNGSYYDAFRNRLMFPVINPKGDVIGFSGRILGDGEPKYLNSKETLVFNKGKNLFGLNLAKKSKSGYIILVEGNVDVVSLHQAGFDSAVASLGTALTADQARLISRYTNNVIISYDNDGAGIKASQKAINILEKLDVKVKVLRMSGAKDPDEYIKTFGAGAFRNLIEQSEAQFDYRLSNIQAKYDLSVTEQKLAFIKEAEELIAGLSGETERQVYSMRIADIVQLKADTIMREVETRRKVRLNRAKKSEFQTTSRPEKISQPTEKNIKYADPASAVAEEGVIRLIYLEPGLAHGLALSDADFSSPELRDIFNAVMALALNDAPISPAVLSGDLSAAEMNLLTSILQKPEKLSGGNAMNDYIRTITGRRKAKDTPLAELAEELKKQGKAYK